MSLIQHLLELRRRLFIAAVGVLLGAIAGWFLFDPAWNFLQSPMRIISGTEGGKAVINYTSISGAFDVRIQLAATIGLIVSSPLWLYQIFAFLVPGLNRREKRYVLSFLLTAIPLFLVGCAAGLYVMPRIVQVMTSFVPKGDASFIDAKNYLDFILKLSLATGVAFVLPVFLILLNVVGVLQGKTILKSWRWAILTIALFSAISTPGADVLSMFLLAIPMVCLYFAAVGITITRDRAIAKRQSAVDAGWVAEA